MQESLKSIETVEFCRVSCMTAEVFLLQNQYIKKSIFNLPFQELSIFHLLGSYGIFGKKQLHWNGNITR